MNHRPYRRERLLRPSASHPSKPTAGRGKKCGCVAPSSYEVMRLRVPVPYL